MKKLIALCLLLFPSALFAQTHTSVTVEDAQTITGAKTYTAPVDANGGIAVGANATIAGPNPWVDWATSGTTHTVTTSNLSQTCSVNTSSPKAVTLSNAGPYVNGDHIICVGAGSGNSVTTSAPSAPTVTTVISSGPLNSGEVATDAATGSTTYEYEIMWCDWATLACTPPSTATTITTGQATLGETTVAITSIARSGTTATVTTSANHDIRTGSCGTTTCAEILVKQGSDASFTGFARVITVADATHFTYTTPPSTTYGATASETGGNVLYFQGNHIACGTQSVATAFCVVYNGNTGAYMGMGRMGELFWDDWGSTISGSPLRPNFVPSTAPGTYQNNALETTIASGAGGTSIVTTTGASTTVSGQYAILDQCPELQAAATTANSNSSQVYISPTASSHFFVISSYCILPVSSSFLQAGSIWVTAPIVFQSQQNHWNIANGRSVIYISNAAPGIYLPNSVGLSWFDGWNLQSLNGNNGLLVLSDQSEQVYVEDYQFTVGNSGSSYLGMGEVVRSNGFNNYWLRGNIDGNCSTSGSTVGSTTAPNILFLSSSGGPGALIQNTTMNCKGIAQTGNEQMDIKIENLEIQGSQQPAYTTESNSSDANMVQFNHIVVDSSPAPIATFLNGFVQVVSFFGAQHSADTNGLPPLTSGGIISGLYAIGSQFPFGQNFWIQETAADSGFGNFPYVYTPQIFPNGNGSTIAYEQTITPSSAVVNSGGSLTVGAHIYYVTPIWPPASNEGAPGASISATTTSGNQTVAVGWTALSAPGVCYNVYRDGARRNNSPVCTNTFSDTGASGPGQSVPGFSLDGDSHMGKDGFRGPAVEAHTTYTLNGILLDSSTAPTVLAAGCGGSAASIPNANGTASFTVNVGTSNAGSCTITMPAAAHGWNCSATDQTTISTTVANTRCVTGGTTTITLANYSDVAGAHDWTDSDVIGVIATPY